MLVCLLFENSNIMIGLYHGAWYLTKNDEYVPHWLIIGQPISQYASCVAKQYKHRTT